MSQGIHLVSSNIPGFGPVEGKCLLCSGVPGRAVTVSSYSYHGDVKPFPPVKILLKKSPSFFSKRASSRVCTASSSNHRRNPDFSRQNKQNHGFSRNKNRQNLDRDNSENLEDSEILSSKNGPLLSLSTSPRFQATATPGPREKEIVELFRKVQAQLRERAAIKEEKKMEASQGQGKESETVDSLLKLLRKHSVEQGKRRTSSSSRDFVLEQPEQQNIPFDEEQNTNFLNSNSNSREEAQEPNANPFRRPVSNFRRKSPVPRVKYEPVYSPKDNISSLSSSKLQGRRKKNEVEPEPEPEFEPEPEIELESELEEPFSVSSDVHDEVFAEISESESSDVDEAYNDEIVETQSSTQHTDLSALKLSELRVIAKSRGLKGYSKLKKVDLIELLGGD
ncbi:Rho termination factor [Macleaya cordata]|uniref:Rho termination factor n=1 Tax=Macleaya cordata TaxID=56857 RepID=A0A200PW00_MACCD|nr:Rho termination factor [Macleaya cordata]